MPWLLRFWYQKAHPLRYLLYPIHFLLYLLTNFRRWIYQSGIFNSVKVNVPVIVVGNISVGGTGKSPVVIHLAEQLSQAGYKIGILSRGYGGQSSVYPLIVEANSKTEVVGDEPLMIKLITDETVVVDPIRSRGAKFLVNECQCNLIICDDGLQHYLLQRDVEIMVVDGNRQFGNKLLMPFGPLRESISRAATVDAVVVNGDTKLSGKAFDEQFSMTLKSNCFVSLTTNQAIDVKKFPDYCKNNNSSTIQAVAGIGHPERFFNQLEELGMTLDKHSFDDHHQFSKNDFDGMSDIIVMTEKDAVKCNAFATELMWYLKVEAEIEPSISQFCLDLLKKQ